MLFNRDLETISFHGYASRAFAPDYRPNEADIRSHLEKAVKGGFSKDRADQIIEAWNKTEIEKTDSGDIDTVSLVVLFAIAFGIRLIYILQSTDNPLFGVALVDAKAYARWAGLCSR